MDTGLEGHRALVTGSSAGIGLAVAKGLAREGARVAMVARREPVLREAATAIGEETGAPPIVFPGDLTDREQVRRCVTDAATSLGGIDVLVTNAGGPPPGRFADLEPEAFEAAFRLTFQSALWLCHESLPFLRASGTGGRIVMIASTSVKEPLDGLILSNSIRSGLAGLAKSLANELGPDGIRVNVVCPGFTDTERLGELADRVAAERGCGAEAVRDEWAARNPLRRIGRPEEIADLAVFLASDRASYITGTTIAVDGGRTRGLL
ncbi:MAG: SDR family oxidoreductase [Acidobacteriota bacterium]|jgi:3-oxoacyl-[acyl-carrier protein] reductase